MEKKTKIVNRKSWENCAIYIGKCFPKYFYLTKMKKRIAIAKKKDYNKYTKENSFGKYFCEIGI